MIIKLEKIGSDRLVYWCKAGNWNMHEASCVLSGYEPVLYWEESAERKMLYLQCLIFDIKQHFLSLKIPADCSMPPKQWVSFAKQKFSIKREISSYFRGRQ